MDAKRIFEILAREGECWVEPGETRICGGIFKRSPLREYALNNPDFTTPDGFFWAWERAQEKDLIDKFIDWMETRSADHTIIIWKRWEKMDVVQRISLFEEFMNEQQR